MTSGRLTSREDLDGERFRSQIICSRMDEETVISEKKQSLQQRKSELDSEKDILRRLVFPQPTVNGGALRPVEGGVGKMRDVS